MIRRLVAVLCALLALLALPRTAAAEALPRVRLETSAGSIVIELEAKRAPVTAGNFLAYVDGKKFDGTTFYRAARNKRAPEYGLVQGGINHRVVGALLPIEHEPTTKTGLRHIDGTVSMARNAPGTAMGDFFITIGKGAYLDARGDYAGYAAFGQVVEGMDVVRKILAAPTYPGGRSENTIGQSIIKPIRIIRARRVE
ncbi:peptidylprolyl isomerase [Sphingosinicella humi]|uniref:peptidylprolyl isomerase n=1 Tax=Allosphingosinicella humi TaxID=2068657 RepID=A0A2U2IZJ0_9SPHN|nr:peptidylprolyl isomerase [Sphingosinicella humi]PWG01489.1 peptidylprolyl isomerase [Sphingosinicella humi]